MIDKSKEGQPEQNEDLSWWASGDTPVHKGNSRVSYFVDGRSALFALCCTLLKARSSIFMADWGLTAKLDLVRGKEKSAGPAGSPEQEALLALLRAEGLQEEEIFFWQNSPLTLKTVLGYAVRRGVTVNVLLWNSLPLPAYAHYFPRLTYRSLREVGVTCLLDNSARGILHHPAESLHQKMVVVDNRWAFVGGIDAMIEKNDDFDRWDSSLHEFSTHLRQTSAGTTPHPWHDVHALIEGAAVADVTHNFQQRWNAVVERYKYWQILPKQRRFYQHLHVAAGEAAQPVAGTDVVQLARTIPRYTYHFRPHIVRGIAQLYLQAIQNARRFIYLENQYLWVRAYTGLDISFLGRDNPQMEQFMRSLIEALRRGVSVTLVLPDHPAPGRAFSDASVARIRREAPEAVHEGRFHAFCLGTSTQQGSDEHYRPVYVHAKVAIIDDLWATVGSANLNNRGLRDDVEMNVATLDEKLVRSLRLRLWAEHLGLLSDDELFALNIFCQHQLTPDPQTVNAGDTQGQQAERELGLTQGMLPAWQKVWEDLRDPEQGMQRMERLAWQNIQAYKNRQPFHGHLLPYLVGDEARQQGLPFREEHGWLEEESN